MKQEARGLPPLLREAGVTRRQAEVLEAVTDRLSNAEIAARLFVSVRTVESHVSALLAKLHAADRGRLAEIGRTLVGGPVTSARLPLPLVELVERGPFVGRHGEIAILRRRWEEAVARRRRVVFVVGEAGIGKSRLVAEAAVAADRGGAAVLVGHCDEDALVVYQPVVEALNRLVDVVPREVVAGAARAAGPALLRLLPALAPLVSRQPPREPAAADLARYRLFEDVAGLLAAAADDAPVLLILEDLHWADAPTLQLLRHLVRRADRTRLLVTATVRGARLDGPLLGLVEDLRREHGCDVVSLGGLTVSDVGMLLVSHAGRFADLGPERRQALAERVHEFTEGNPFFVGEVLRHLSDSAPDRGRRDPVGAFGVPETVRDVIVRRTAGLGDLARHVLSVAAVAGRAFRVDVVAQASDLTEDRLLDALDEAQRAELVGDVPGRPGWLAFSHALVHETLEQELSSARRQRLHRRVGEILEAEDAAGNLAGLAHHFHIAATPADHEQAVAYAVAAAEEAETLLAHERAAQLYGRALEALALAPQPDPQRCCDLLLRRANAYRRGGLHEPACDSALQAVRTAVALDDPQRLADAALAVGESAPVWSSDPELSAVLEAALRRIGQRDPQRQARLLARLAQAEYYSASPARRRDLSQQAVTVAQTTGDDATLAAVLSARHVALWGPDDTEERLAVAEEILALARVRGDEELALQGHAWRLVDLLELGDVAAADHAIAAHALLARRLGQPLHLRDSALWAAMRALLDGRFADAERESMRALHLGWRAQDPHADMFRWIHRYWLVLDQDASSGDIADLLDISLELADSNAQVPSWRAKVALLYARLGDRDNARHALAQLSPKRFADLPRDAVWIAGLYYLAEVAAFLAEREQAAVLYQLLLPYRNRAVVVDRALLCLGSVSRVLGLLAAVLNDPATATDHLRTAIATHDQMGARPLSARTRFELTQLLLHHDPSAPELSELLTTAARDAKTLGMTRLTQQIGAP